MGYALGCSYLMIVFQSDPALSCHIKFKNTKTGMAKMLKWRLHKPMHHHGYIHLLHTVYKHLLQPWYSADNQSPAVRHIMLTLTNGAIT